MRLAFRAADFAASVISAAVFLYAQTPPAFDAASVKRVPADDPTHRSAHASVTANEHGARITLESTTLRDLIQRAYGVAAYQIAGPEWISVERYDVAATSSSPEPAQIAKMWQTLLAERFQLAVHRETRVGPLYHLIVASGGPKLSEGVSGAPGGIHTSSDKLVVKLTAVNQTVASLVDRLSEVVGRPVVDQTGLSGVYSFELVYARTDDSPSPPIASAIAQLGLKLQSGKGPVEFLVVDRAERTPTPN